MNFQEQFGINVSVFIAGLMGGIASLTFEHKISAFRASLLIVTGATTAAYLQPVAEHYLSVPEKLSTGLGFILGLVSMKVVEFLLENTKKVLSLRLLRHDANSTTASEHLPDYTKHVEVDKTTSEQTSNSD